MWPLDARLALAERDRELEALTVEYERLTRENVNLRAGMKRLRDRVRRLETELAARDPK